MKVGWLADPGNADGTLGGAELTQAEFKAAAPDGVEIVEVQAHDLSPLHSCEVACVFNCVGYPAGLIGYLSDKRVVRYFNDVAPHGSKELTLWLLAKATCVFTSPLHLERFPWINGQRPDTRLIPPPVDLEPFRRAAEGAQERAGAVAVGPWMNPGKAPYLALEWAQNNGQEITFAGGGPFAPPGSLPVAYEDIPELFANYRTFVHLPTALEPFGRTVVEAWAAGCDVITNSLVGARWWINQAPDKLETAAQDFWALVGAQAR